MKGFYKKFDKLKEWILNNGYTLESGKDDAIYFDAKLITINFSKNREHIIFSLLHECGHLKTFNKVSYIKEFSKLNLLEDDKRVLRTNRYKYELLKDEMLAWEGGLELANELGIKLDIDSYYTYASKWFMTYVKWIK